MSPGATFFPGSQRQSASHIEGEIAFQLDVGVDPKDGGVETEFFWKQERHRTGRPCVGRNGTVVSSLQAEHLVRVSVRTRGPPLARLALHCLQCLGSFLKSLSWKNSCSPAVKMNSAPQSMHLSTRSTNSMAGIPKPRIRMEIGHIPLLLPVPYPCFLTLFHNKGPGRLRFAANQSHH